MTECLLTAAVQLSRPVVSQIEAIFAYRTIHYKNQLLPQLSCGLRPGYSSLRPITSLRISLVLPYISFILESRSSLSTEYSLM